MILQKPQVENRDYVSSATTTPTWIIEFFRKFIGSEFPDAANSNKTWFWFKATNLAFKHCHLAGIPG